MSLRRVVPRGVMCESVRTLHPGYFALVMATGIVSVGVHGSVLPAVPAALMWFAAAAYIVLLALHGWRVVAFTDEVRRDLSDPARGFGFFTFVAGTNVLGVRLELAHHRTAAAVLLVIGVLGWLTFGYLVPWNVALGGAGRPLVAVANGTWFIWGVATQSVAVLAATVEPTVGAGRRELALLAVGCWSIGAFLYATVGLLVAARLLMYDVSPADLTPPYWVAMGASAITVLAGARIVQMAEAPALTAIHDLIVGASLVFWAFASWLIPALVAAGWWRHAVHRVPLRYDATLWSIVFPLGMYGVASRALGETVHLPVVAAIGHGEIYVAVAAWAVVAVAMLTYLVRPQLRCSR